MLTGGKPVKTVIKSKQTNYIKDVSNCGQMNS